jgi:hypothetical protein
LRYLPAGSMVEITVRTVHGRLLLRPGLALNDLVVGVLGRAQSKYAMVIHAAVFLSNHFHLLVSPDSPKQLAAFMNFLDGNLAKEIGRLHDWRDKVWSRRYTSIVVSDEEDAQVGRLAYVLAHGVKEGFVPDPREWPGVHCAAALLDGSQLVGTWFDRTAEYRARNRKAKRSAVGGAGGSAAVGDGGGEGAELAFQATETINFSPLPCWRELTATDARARVGELISRIVAEAQQARAGRPPLGRAKVLKQSPHERPMRSDRSPAPAVHAASRAIRLALRQLYWDFVTRFREAANRLRAGDRLVVFPRGAFPPPIPSHAPS